MVTGSAKTVTLDHFYKPKHGMQLAMFCKEIHTSLIYCRPWAVHSKKIYTFNVPSDHNSATMLTEKPFELID